MRPFIRVALHIFRPTIVDRSVIDDLITISKDKPFPKAQEGARKKGFFVGGSSMSIIPNYVPSQFKTVNVVLSVRNAPKALEFYNRAFGAEEVMRLADPNGVVVHAEIRIADTIIILMEEDPKLSSSPSTLGGTPVTIQLYTPDVEGFIEEAVLAGAEVIEPVKEQFWGDRAGRLRDPFGHQWIVATHMENMTAAEMQKRFQELFV